MIKTLLILAPLLQMNPLIQKKESFDLVRPAGSYQTIVEWYEDDFHCLVYKTPLGKEKGSLIKLVGKTPGCSLSKGERETLLETKSLSIQNINLNRGLKFEVKAEDKTFKYDFPFASEENSFWPSFFPKVEFSLKGKLPLKKGDLCLQRGRDCRNQGTSMCGDCPDGQWTSFIDLNCSQKISAICGNSQCGGKEQKACLKLTTLKKAVTCKDIEPFVYCQVGLEVECQSNGEVTCR